MHEKNKYKTHNFNINSTIENNDENESDVSKFEGQEIDKNLEEFGSDYVINDASEDSECFNQ